MHRIASPLAREWPLFDIAASRRIESAALAQVPPHTLMRRAGLAVARLALALAPHAQTVRIIVGPGNNGGDGFEAALNLQHLGKPVEVLCIGTPASADAQDALARARAAGVTIDPPQPRALTAQDLTIDALLGLGGTRAPAGLFAQAIAELNALPCPVLAVDLPSGLDADSGQPLDPLATACVRATHTLSLLTLKPGLFTAAGRDHAGQIWLDTLGCDTHGDAPSAWLAAPTPAPTRRHTQHKGSFGDVAIVGGAPGMAGAALLAARAAHAAGGGRIFVELLDAAAPALDAQRPELMLRAGWTQRCSTLADTTVVCGCGGGEAVAAMLPTLLAKAARLVLDADALNHIAADAALAAQLHSRAARQQATVLTPHPLEAARLLGSDAAAVQAQRLQAAQTLAERHGCVVLLKGSGSVLAAPGRTPRINPSGNAALASPGTGDVLAGWLGGHWAQRRESEPLQRAFAAAQHAAWLHGAAADQAGMLVLRAGALIDAMAAQRR